MIRRKVKLQTRCCKNNRQFWRRDPSHGRTCQLFYKFIMDHMEECTVFNRGGGGDGGSGAISDLKSFDLHSFDLSYPTVPHTHHAGPCSSLPCVRHLQSNWRQRKDKSLVVAACLFLSFKLSFSLLRFSHPILFFFDLGSRES